MRYELVWMVVVLQKFLIFNSQYPGRITFVCVGPLTNVALAIKMYHDFADKVKALYLMGGNCNGTQSSDEILQNFPNYTDAFQLRGIRLAVRNLISIAIPKVHSFY